MPVIVTGHVLHAQPIPGKPGMLVQAAVTLYSPDAKPTTDWGSPVTVHLTDHHDQTTPPHYRAEQPTEHHWLQDPKVQARLHHLNSQTPGPVSPGWPGPSTTTQENTMTQQPDTPETTTPAPTPVRVSHRAAVTLPTLCLAEIVDRMTQLARTVPADATVEITTSRRERRTHISATWTTEA